MLPPNRAAALLRRIQRETVERAQWAVLGLLVAAGPALVLPVLLSWLGLALGLLALGAVTLRTMFVLEGIIAGGLARGALVEVARLPVGRVWHIVGAE